MCPHTNTLDKTYFLTLSLDKALFLTLTQATELYHHSIYRD